MGMLHFIQYIICLIMNYQHVILLVKSFVLLLRCKKRFLFLTKSKKYTLENVIGGNKLTLLTKLKVTKKAMHHFSVQSMCWCVLITVFRTA